MMKYLWLAASHINPNSNLYNIMIGFRGRLLQTETLIQIFIIL